MAAQRTPINRVRRSLAAVRPISQKFQPSQPGQKSIHWSMRLMSLVSLLALAIYTYVFSLCRRQARATFANQLPNPKHENRRVKLATTAFTLDLLISAYFGAITPILLKRGGLILDRKTMPRPLFWFFAITGFVPTATMTITVIGGQRWQQNIRTKKAWHTFHGITALIAYFSWWIACSPVIVMSLIGEEKTLAWARKNGLLKDDTSAHK